MSTAASVSNHPTIVSLDTMTIAEIATLPGALLFGIQKELDIDKALLERRQIIFRAAEELKYGDAARKRLAEDATKEGAGITRILDGDHTCVCEVKKAVKWDQPKLDQLWDAIVTAGEEPTVYMRRELKVSETALKTWPVAVRAEFEKARTISHGKMGFIIEPAVK